MEATLLVYGIIALTVLIILTVLAVVAYSGLFYEIKVGAGSPPIQNAEIAYKFRRGPYQNSGEIFTEVSYLTDKGSKCFGVYYDDPKQVPQHQLRYAVGCILAEGTKKPDESLVKKLEEKGFKFAKFPQVSNVVKTQFPFRTTLSIFIGVFRVYPELGRYVLEKKLCAHPYLELYDGDMITYFAPLAKQDEFYVPEAFEELEEEEDVEDSEEIDREESATPDDLSMAGGEPMSELVKDRLSSSGEGSLLKRKDSSEKSKSMEPPATTRLMEEEKSEAIAQSTERSEDPKQQMRTGKGLSASEPKEILQEKVITSTTHSTSRTPENRRLNESSGSDTLGTDSLDHSPISSQSEMSSLVSGSDASVMSSAISDRSGSKLAEMSGESASDEDNSMASFEFVKLEGDVPVTENKEAPAE